eukprot:3106504-Pyramimonas_sp.AAC.1
MAFAPCIDEHVIALFEASFRPTSSSMSFTAVTPSTSWSRTNCLEPTAVCDRSSIHNRSDSPGRGTVKRSITRPLTHRAKRVPDRSP